MHDRASQGTPSSSPTQRRIEISSRATSSPSRSTSDACSFLVDLRDAATDAHLFIDALYLSDDRRPESRSVGGSAPALDTFQQPRRMMYRVAIFNGTLLLRESDAEAFATYDDDPGQSPAPGRTSLTPYCGWFKSQGKVGSCPLATRAIRKERSTGGEPQPCVS